MKLTIRDLMWLVLVAAVAFGWLQSYRRQAGELDDARLRASECRSAAADVLRKTGVIDTLQNEMFAAKPGEPIDEEMLQRNRKLLSEIGLFITE